MSPVDTTQRAHELIDRMAPGQLTVIVNLLEMLLDPVARSIANAPWDDEPVSEEEHREIAAARTFIARGELISHKEVLAEYGLMMEDFEEHRPLSSKDREPVGRPL